MYDSETRLLCQSAAWASKQSPRIDAAMEAAADSAPVMARWIPEEKKGSMNANAHQSGCGHANVRARVAYLRHRRRS